MEDHDEQPIADPSPPQSSSVGAVDVAAIEEEQWLVVPVIDDDGSIRSSRVVREIADVALGPLTTLVEIVVRLDERTKIKKLDEQGDRLAAAFPRETLVDVCRIIEPEHWRWCAYVLPAESEAVRERAAKIFHSFAGDLTLDDDATRQRLAALQPSPLERHTARDVQVLTQLAASGDEMSAVRDIDHVLHFESNDDAVAAAAALAEADFLVSEPRADDASPSSFVVDIRREGIPELSALRAVRAEVERVCDEAALVGPMINDGWGCPVVLAVEPGGGAPSKPRGLRRFFSR